ncbi:MAG: complex I NDUFA9 subunit family protein [Bdellovibrionales bacterium]
MFQSRQLTLFGGTGFIGRLVVRRLAQDGYIVRVPTRNPETALELKPAGNVAQIVPMACNVRSDASVARAIGQSDAVINLIGILYERGRNTFEALHVETAARIARLAREQGAEGFVHMSALGADAHSASAYARSKAAGEKAVRAFFPEAAILRPSIVFGPEDNFFNRFALMARIFPALPLIGGGGTKFQPVYAGDIAEAAARILAKPEWQGQVYELGGPQVYSFRQLLEIMLDEIGRKRRLVDLPWGLAKFKAAILEMLPMAPMLTRDQVELLKTDNVVKGGAKTLRDIGIAPTALEVILPTYMDRFRVGGTLKAA